MEWLEHASFESPLSALVVCSDASAGGSSEDIRTAELTCRSTTDVSEIKKALEVERPNTLAVFSTYQSLSKVIEAQEAGAPGFNLAIADEAHRTTGIDTGQTGAFQLFHHDLRAVKRLYMTATPRVYTEGSKARIEAKGATVVDMDDVDVYGHELHRITFKEAVEQDALSDYRVIVLGVNESVVGEEMRRSLERDWKESSQGRQFDAKTITRVFGTFLAVSGGTVSEGDDAPGSLSSTLAFASTIARSKWYARAFENPDLKGRVTRALRQGGCDEASAVGFTAQHLDGSHSAHKRQQAIHQLKEATERRPQLVANCKLFTEGVDVPALDAVAFLDAKNSQVDIVQAVGRVMRRAQGKRLGYIIVPVVLEPDQDVLKALSEGGGDFATVGKVLRALQSHDERLSEDVARFVDIQITPPHGPGGDGEGPWQVDLPFEKATHPGIYARLLARSGLHNAHLNVAEEISACVKRAGGKLHNEALAEPLAQALGKDAPNPDDEKEEVEICQTASLVVMNAALLHRRLRKEAGILDGLEALEDIVVERYPAHDLVMAWKTILRHDYKPVFNPALAVVKALDEYSSPASDSALKSLINAAKNQADKLSELGFDYAGPLYHKILASAKSDGAFYTKNTSAMLLAGLAMPPTSDPIWSDFDRVANLKLIDPACGTGTLLMAALNIAKRRLANADDAKRLALHKALVENGIHGMDINSQAVQMAASNLTFGATSVDYKQMNLQTLPHGVDSKGAKAGALDLLLHKDPNTLLKGLVEKEEWGQQVDGGRVELPEMGFDLVIMNPPFSNNQVRNSKFSADDKKAMQEHEKRICNEVEKRDNQARRQNLGPGLARAAISANSVGSYFPVIAERLLTDREGATIAEVVPLAGLNGAGSAAWRRFLAHHFHIECLVACHANRAKGESPTKVGFTSNETQFECLMVARRRSPDSECPPTQIITLKKHPLGEDECLSLLAAIESGDMDEWGILSEWPRAKIETGDWSVVAWEDPELPLMLEWLEAQPQFEQIGDEGGAISTRVTTEWVDE